MSKSEINFVAPTQELIELIALDMRSGDRTEVWLSHKHLPLDAIQRSVACSKNDCYVAVAGTKPICIFGVANPSKLCLWGSPWLLGTLYGFLHYRKEIGALSRPMVNYLRGGYTRLENWVHADNIISVRWLASCGFTIEPAEPYGPFGALFHRFWMTGDLTPCANPSLQA